LVSEPVLETLGLGVTFGGHAAVVDVSCKFDQGTLTAIVGPNGAGKTTYFNLVSGQVRATSGRILLGGKDITLWPIERRVRAGIGRAFQLTNLFPRLSTFENLRLAVQAQRNIQFDIARVASRLLDVTASTESLLELVDLADQRNTLAYGLSHGDQRKLEIAMLTALEPKFMMFDEPTAGMSVRDVPRVLDLIMRLKNSGKQAIVLVEHKMDVIDALADRVIVLHQGRLVLSGSPAEVAASDVVQRAYLGRLPDV
jgi:branched-chain amino acid transport system ATP-binding protein